MPGCQLALFPPFDFIIHSPYLPTIHTMRTRGQQRQYHKKKVSQYQYIILGRLCLLRRGCDGIFLLTVPPNRRGYSPSMGDGGGDGGVDLRFVMMWRGGDGVLARHPLQSSSCMRGFVFDWRRRQTMRGQRQSRSPLRLRCGGRRVSGASKIVVFDYSI